ncbi:MAG TPA: hypothetical protein VM261_21480 [Kofleriaceae bacterium]|nr:hypothetical protein [Kofleriaceae bacterium]
MRVLRLIEVQRARECIVASCALDDLRFHVTVWYEDVDLDALAARHGAELLDRIAFHVAMFQLNAVASLRPDAIELGAYARFATPAFVALWRTVFKKVWGQWRWEHQLPDYGGPTFIDLSATVAPARPGGVERGEVDWLVFCGGGKDSLVALELFERGGLRFATLGYSHSIYGQAAPQHALLERVAGATGRARAERQWIVDDFLDAPVVALRPSLGVRSVLAAETPASVFAALPIALARGYRGLVVAHEHSANTGNLVWEATGEEVNHQWGKGWEAEQLLDAYVQRELVGGVRYFSVLQPVHDEVIFELLARDAALAPNTHSCNVQKPWCGACAKCAYVWLQMSAHLPAEIVAKTFAGRGDLGERPENLRWFRELLGLAEHSPFECVGSPTEARLALAMLAAKRPLGRQLTALAVEVGAIDVPALARPLLDVAETHGMPDEVAAAIMPQLRDAAAQAKRRLG